MDQQAKFEGWALVELFGHQREAGFVTTQYFGNAAMFQLDVPAMEEREFELKQPRWNVQQYLPAGTKVKLAASQARSRLINPSAVYAMNPCTEQAARTAVDEIAPRALVLVELPKDKQLVAGQPEEATAETVLPGEEEYEGDEDSGIDGCPSCGAAEDQECREGCPNA